MVHGEDERAREIIRQINATPGASLRQIVRYTGLPFSATLKLVEVLESEGAIKKEAHGAYRRFYPGGERMHVRERLALAFVNKPRPRAILQAVLGKPGIRHGDLAETVEVPAPTLTYHMKDLLKNKLLRTRKDGTSRHYSVVNPGLVKRAIRRTAKFDGAIAKR